MDKMNSPRFEHEGVEDLPQEATEFTTVIAPENGDEDSPITPKSIPILPLRDTVVFPEAIVPLAVGQSRSVKLIDHVLSGDKLVGLVAVKDPQVELPGPNDAYDIGTLSLVQKMMKSPDGTLRILVQGIRRIRVDHYLEEEPFLSAEVSNLDDLAEEGKELEALQRNLTSIYSRIVQLVPYLPEELEMAALNIENPSTLGFFIASTMRIGTEEKQQLLEEIDVARRLRHLTEIVNRELEVLELGSKIQTQVQSEMDKSQREYFLRQQLKAIKEELGEADETQAEVHELRQRLEEAEVPEAVEKQAVRELERLEKLPPAAAEYGVIRTYLDWILSLPWSTRTEDNLDLTHARSVLDEDHYDLEDVKDRILEFLAVQKLRKEQSGPILCFVGPPGVGKTSLGQSIARALGRHFIRISVGGVRDEAEIRGHRRTYVGAMPGTIIRAIRDAGSTNPVFMIDEIDKMGADFRGDPSSAMLEVLDPEQHDTFRDHYLDLPYDLSQVMFITTANILDTIPGPLRDRMEIISLAGYIEEDKAHIARRYLIPRQLERHGLKEEQLEITDDGLKSMIQSYTREAGVRNLERQIGAVARKFARLVAEEQSESLKVDADNLSDLLGKKKVFQESKRRTSDPGVATGLAWTPTGGDILFIEARAMPGDGTLILTGQLGDVMKESARAALTYIRSIATSLDVATNFFRENDIHIHVPAGAVPKDGPSAGVAIALALASMISNRPVDADIAVTGEITLSGQILPVGGIKEKVLAARRAEITKVVLPDHNEADVEEIQDHLLEGIKVIYADQVDTVIRQALTKHSKGEVPSADKGKGNGKGKHEVSAMEIARLAGVKPDTVRGWTRRYPDFPSPLNRGQGRHLYNRARVLAWLEKTGRARREPLPQK